MKMKDKYIYINLMGFLLRLIIINTKNIGAKKGLTKNKIDIASIARYLNPPTKSEINTKNEKDTKLSFDGISRNGPRIINK